MEVYWSRVCQDSIEARNLVNKLIKRIKIQYYRHKLEYADNEDMFNIVNSLIKPKTESLPNCVCAEECCNKLADFFQEKIKTQV